MQDVKLFRIEKGDKISDIVTQYETGVFTPTILNSKISNINAGNNIGVVRVGNDVTVSAIYPSGSGNDGAFAYNYFSATTGQTVFNLSFIYVTGNNNLLVFINGTKQLIGNDYIETNSTTVTLTSNTLLSGDIVEFVYPNKGLNWKGTYSGASNYIKGDGVSYNGSSYICKLASIGNLPTNTTYWDVLASMGDTGPSVPDGDKGDITVSSLGTVWTIDNNVISNAKVATMATKTYKGRTTAGTGNVEDVPVATLKTDLTLVKGDVGLGNVDNTSDATKNSAIATLTNKTINLTSNTLSGTKAQFNTACSDGDFIFAGDISGGNLTETTSSVLTITGGTNAVLGAGTTIQVKQANATTNGYTSSTDWNTFNNKEPAITAGTTAQYYRGDKSWQTLDKTAVGLANVDNTSDATKNSASATLTNKSLSDSTTYFVDNVDNTKKLNIDVTGTTGITGVLQSTFTTAKTLILPDANDTLIGKATTDTLTNKTINLTSNTLSGTKTQFNTACSDDDFIFAGASATLTNKSLSDSTTYFVDNVDNTKKLNIDVTGTTGITGVLQSTFTTAKTLILPDANDTLVGKATTDTLTNKTIAFGSNTVSGTKAQFDTACTDGDFVYKGDLVVGTITSTDGQTVFTVPIYTADRIQIFLNGVLQTKTTDYTETNSTTITLATSELLAGDIFKYIIL